MRKIFAAGIVGVLSLVPVVLSAPSAQAQAYGLAPDGMAPATVCKIDGSWNFSESRAHSPARITDFVNDGLILDVTGDRTHDAGNTVGGKVAGYVQIDPVLLSDIDVATLDYVSSVGTAKPGYQLVVDRTPSDPLDGYDGILVGEPSAYGDVWWATKPTRWVGGPENIAVGTNSDVDGTLAEFATFDPDARVVAVGFSLGTLGVGTEARGVLKTLTFNGSVWDFGICPSTTPTTTTTTTTTSPTTTTTTSSESSSTSTTTTGASTTTSTTPVTSTTTTTSTTDAAVVPVGNNTNGLAYTGTSGIGTYLGIAGFLIALGAGSFIWLRIQRKRELL